MELILTISFLQGANLLARSRDDFCTPLGLMNVSDSLHVAIVNDVAISFTLSLSLSFPAHPLLQDLSPLNQ